MGEKVAERFEIVRLLIREWFRDNGNRVGFSNAEVDVLNLSFDADDPSDPYSRGALDFGMGFMRCTSRPRLRPSAAMCSASTGLQRPIADAAPRATRNSGRTIPRVTRLRLIASTAT